VNRESLILVADRPAGIQTIHNVMGSDFHIMSATSFADAKSLLQTSKLRFSLILCGVHFDDSRMFDLATLVQHSEPRTHGPLVIFRDLDSQLDAAFFRSIQLSAKVLGAAGFIDLFDLKLKHGLASADAHFRQYLIGLIDSC
jgi:hypothetical protein